MLTFFSAVEVLSEVESEDTAPEPDATTTTKALVCSDSDKCEVKPIVIYEVKKEPYIVCSSLREVLLQAYYSLTLYDVTSCIYCLTNGWEFTYWKVKVTSTKLEIEWQKKI